MDKDPKAPRRVSEALGDFGPGETIDEEGTQGFVLTMPWGRWLEKELATFG